MKPTCVIKEEGTDTLVFDCAANCVGCDFQDTDDCGDYEFTAEEKEEALLRYQVEKQKGSLDNFVMRFMAIVIEKRAK